MAAAPNKKVNFGAGPAKIPEPVMEKAQREFLLFGNTGTSICEISHRSADFTNVINQTVQLFRDQMGTPADYSVMFMQGGGTGQFAAIPLNLGAFSKSTPASADYAVTGSWSSKAVEEGSKFINARKVFTPTKPFVSIPSEWDRDPNAAYLYYCANETIHGVEYQSRPETLPGVPLVADISSNFLSRPFDWTDHGLVFGGAQKNLGIAGLTVVFARQELIGKESPQTPAVLSYKETASNNSCLNTPPVFGIYITKLVLEWIRDQGGVQQVYDVNKRKAASLYGAIDASDGFYSCPVKKDVRSLMNIPFRVGGGDDALETAFLKGASERGMMGLKGHRSVGGIRASLYNAVTEAETAKLVDWMSEFRDKNAKH